MSFALDLMIGILINCLNNINNLKFSGDSIILLLTKRYVAQPKSHVEISLEWNLVQIIEYIFYRNILNS